MHRCTPDPLGAPQRQQRPRRGRLHRPDRPRPRRRHRRRRRRADRLPGHRLGRRPCCRPPGGAVVPLRVDAVHHARRAPAGRRSRASSAAGSAGRTTRSSCCATPTPPTSPCPSWRPPADVGPAAPGAAPPLGCSRRLPRDRRLGELDGFQARAFDLLTSPATQRAFQLDREPAAGRATRYGRNIYGQSVLLARRLIEAGTRVACISWAPDANATWDTHGNNFAKLKDDAAAAARRGRRQPARRPAPTAGMLERTLVVVMGEFGRTPEGQRRRPAATTGTSATACCWPAAASRAGYVHGASDKHRRPAEPATR